MTAQPLPDPSASPQTFSERACGHRVPLTRKKCPWCQPPRLSAAPLAALLRSQAPRFGGTRQMSVAMATRLGMRFERVERHVSRILSGEVSSVRMETADEMCVALGGDCAATIWGDEWFDANPTEPYGDEDF